MSVQIQIRRGSAAQWSASNPILAEGELAVELDTEKFKIGKGTTHWNDLAYATGIPGAAGVAGAAGPTGPSLTHLAQIGDVNTSPLIDQSVLVYQASSSLWKASVDLPALNLDGGQY